MMSDSGVESSGDPKEFEARVTRSRERARVVAERLSESDPTVKMRTSPIAAMLEPYADEIRAALDRGWSAGAIARKLCEAQVEFSADSIRLRIRKMFAKGASAGASSTTTSQPKAARVRARAGQISAASASGNEVKETRSAPETTSPHHVTTPPPSGWSADNWEEPTA